MIRAWPLCPPLTLVKEVWPSEESISCVLVTSLCLILNQRRCGLSHLIVGGAYLFVSLSEGSLSSAPVSLSEKRCGFCAVVGVRRHGFHLLILNTYQLSVCTKVVLAITSTHYIMRNSSNIYL